MPKLRTKTTTTIDVSDWDDFVKSVYGRPYNFQQQDGCKSRGTAYLFIDKDDDDDEGYAEEYDFRNDTIPEVVNHKERGVSFKAWLARDPKQPLPGGEDSFGLELWWKRNFYPSIEMIARDLQKRGLLEVGEYTIIIDW